MQNSMLKNYLEDLFKTAKLGGAREESYYPDFKNLLISFIQTQNKNFNITVLPRKTEDGNPDCRIWDGKGKIVGYIEAKDPKTTTVKSLAIELAKRTRFLRDNVIAEELKGIAYLLLMKKFIYHRSKKITKKKSIYARIERVYLLE